MALTSVLPFQSGYFSASAAHPAGNACAPAGIRTAVARIAPSAALRHGSDACRALVKSPLCMLPAPSNLSWRLPCSKTRKKAYGHRAAESLSGDAQKIGSGAPAIWAGPAQKSVGSTALHRRRAVGVERLDRLQPPGLALLALFLGPDDRLPVGRENEAGAGVGDLDAVAAGLPDIQEEGLLDRVLV